MSSAPTQADGFEMSSARTEQRNEERAWPHFQHLLYQLPELVDTAQEWDNPNLAAEYIRIYGVTKEKVLEAEPGKKISEKLHSHCFFSPDGTKHFVSRLASRPHDRVNEIRLSPDGTVVRLSYEKTQGETQNLDSLFETGLMGLEDDVDRFAHYPNYVMRFFILLSEGEYLKSTFRGISFYDQETDSVLTQEAQELGG